MLADSIALTEGVYYILLALHQPLHGYGIMQQVEQMSKGRVVLAAGTLYGALNNLVARGWIVALPMATDSRRKSYQITTLGKQMVEAEIARLQELLDNGLHIIAQEKGGAEHEI